MLIKFVSRERLLEEENAQTEKIVLLIISIALKLKYTLK